MIFLNIGSNLNSVYGDRFCNIKQAINLLSHIKIIKISSFYETPSYPNKKNPKFLNIAVKLVTNLTPIELLKKIKIIEKKMGRIKKSLNEPRICDIDIIDFKGINIKNKILQLPHPRLHTRNFVLYPLKEIEPNWIHPIFNENIDFFLNKLNNTERMEITRINKNVIIC